MSRRKRPLRTRRLLQRALQFQRFVGASRVAPSGGARLVEPELVEGFRHFRRRDVVRVVRDQTQQEGAVLSQVVVDEILRVAVVVVVVVVVVSFRLHIALVKVITHEAQPVAMQQRARRPQQEAQHAGGRHEHHPEPAALQRVINMAPCVHVHVQMEMCRPPPWLIDPRDCKYIIYTCASKHSDTAILSGK